MCGYEPFMAENDNEMFKKILKCDFKFDSPWWDDVSENAKVKTSQTQDLLYSFFQDSSTLHFLKNIPCKP